MITAVIQHKNDTLVVELPKSNTDLQIKLLSIGVRTLPQNIKLFGGEDAEVDVQLASGSRVGQHLCRLFNTKNSLGDVNTTAYLVQTADESIKTDLEHDIYYHFGANITDANGNGKLLREELQRRDEVNELIMTEDCIEINYHLAYCQNCGEGGISGTLDLLSLLGCNLYDVHFTCDDQGSTPISQLSADMLTEEGKREWADVLSAKVESITSENESFKCKLANCDPERLKAFTEMLNGQCDAEDYERWVKSSGITYPQTEDHSPTLSM